ncbi:universal stress protein [uncultured Sulfitobacter sp.]|uniref:universal stress protein n=1 Tax=uncultured Sulfitobacter sp. TaxID=191468 RepID=UPI00262D2DF6|nr:universal stress protein [uncultured Sulfitobacter sp.]
MKNATLLVVLGIGAKPTDLEPLSSSARDNNLHLNVLVLGGMPPLPVFNYGMGGYGGTPIPDYWHEQVDTQNRTLDQNRKEISRYLADQGASAEVRVVSGETTALMDAVAGIALACDRVVFGDDLRDDPQLFNDALRAALFRAPAGVMLNALQSPSALAPKSVFVSWKASVAASRAAHVALPTLRRADTVTLALFDPVATSAQDGENPGSDVAAWLTHQGCSVEVQQYPSGGGEISKALMQRAKETSADLIVMGAYDHSRLRETVFGGTTRSMIEQHGVPVLLTH